MQIVIDIPHEHYHRAKEYFDIDNIYHDVIKAVGKGIPLPKGHGRLMILSEDKVKANLMNLSFSCSKWISEVGLSDATLKILEAEMENA